MTKIVKRPVIFFDVVNANGRMYTKEFTMPIVDNFMEKRNKFGAAYGTMGYPDKYELSLNNVSHSVDRLYECENILFADITILPSSMGPTLLSLIDDVVFRTNGSGITTEVDGKTVVCLHDILSINAISKSDDSYVESQSEYDRINETKQVIAMSDAKRERHFTGIFERIKNYFIN